MLIPCERHRPEDLALWSELEAADLVHGRSARLHRRVEQSLDAIRTFAAAGPCYASVSHGKDSTALFDLIMRCRPDLPLVHLRVTPSHNPYCDAVRDLLLARWPTANYHEIPIDYSDLDRLHLSDAADDKLTDDRFYAGFREASRRFGDRHISGIRREESCGRRARFRRYGLASPHALGPLGWWTTHDVFGYLAVEGLPVHPNYAMLGGGRWQRDHVRVAELGDVPGTHYGRNEWEREYYGDERRRLGRP